MRITFVLPDANMTGGTKAIAELAKALTKRGHSILLTSQPPRPPSLLNRFRAYRHAIRTNRRLPKFGAEPNHIDGTGLRHIVRNHPGPVRDTDLPNVDVVVATWWQTAEPVFRLPPSKGVKVYFMQDYGAPGMELESLVPTWRLPMHIVTISTWLADLITEHVGSRQVDLMPDGVDNSFFYSGPRQMQVQPTIGFLYREFAVKGYDVVKNAYVLARELLPKLRLITAGPAEPRELPLPDGMEFTYRPDDNELRRIYANCDAWIFASRIEGFGLPILEAMACGTPVIATHAGAAPEILSQGGGVLIEQLDARILAEKMLELVSMTSERWELMSNRARSIAEMYTWESSAEIFEQSLLAAIEHQSNVRL